MRAENFQLRAPVRSPVSKRLSTTKQVAGLQRKLAHYAAAERAQHVFSSNVKGHQCGGFSPPTIINNNCWMDVRSLLLQELKIGHRNNKTNSETKLSCQGCQK